MLKRWITSLGLAILAVPAWANVPAHPGTVNYIEGQVNLNGGRITSRDVGSTELDSGQVLETQQGKAEILLTPGVFLRLGDRSVLRMDSPGLTDTRVELLRGEALVEVTELFKENNVRVVDDGATTTLLKKGLYEFNADQPKVAVLDGKATVSEADQQLELKKGKEADVNAPLKAQKFDRKAHDDLYNWSNVRSEYLAEAAAESARTYVVNGGGWYGPGWYWNNWYGMYSFLPGDGILYSPFGWGFYSPAYVYAAPVYGYRGFGRRVIGNVPARSFRATAPSVGMRAPSMSMRAPGMSMSRGFGAGGGRRR